MSKIKTLPSVLVYPITCSKGHTFYPRVLPDGIVSKPNKCLIRDCRVYLDTERVKKGLAKRQLNLGHVSKPKIKKMINPTIVKMTIDRPRCTICNIVFYDEENLKKHNKRLHQQVN